MKWVIIGLIVALLSGCELGQHTQTKQLEDLFISFTVQPERVTATTEADFYATLRKNRQGVTGCKVQGKQYLPELKKAEEAKIFDIPERGFSGVYYTHSQAFPIAGEWNIDLTIVCGEERYQVAFPLPVIERSL